MIKYNDDNIYVGQIKELLHSFNLPNCKVKKDDSKFYVGEFYVDKKLNGLYRVDSVDANNNLLSSTFIRDYRFNDEILNVTKNLEIKNNYYDSYTHRYLGNYLRFVKDYLDLDLMSMYNCFTNESPNNMSIEVYDRFSNSGNPELYQVNSNSDDYNIFMVPVKSNTTYTLAFDYANSFSIFYGFYSYNHYLIPGDNPPQNSSSIEAQSFKHFNGGIKMLEPKIIKTPVLTSVNELKQEANLKLFIILPNTFTSNIVVLEGDYSKDVQFITTSNYQILGHQFFEYIPEGFEIENGIWKFNGIDTGVSSSVNVVSCTYDNNIHKFTVVFDDSSVWVSPYVDSKGNYDYISRLQLLEFSTNTKYLLADRLQEYLTSNVITHVDEIVDNIKRVQVKLTGYDEDFKFDAYGVWSDSINEWIYKYISTHGNSGDLTFRDIYRDVLCFVDKDIENVINSLHIDILTEEQLAQLSEKERLNYLTKLARQEKAQKILDGLGGIYE